MVGFEVLFFVIKKIFCEHDGKIDLFTKDTILTNNLKNQRSLPLL